MGWARLTSGNDDVIFITQNGQALRFKETEVRAMGRQAAGVMGIKMRKGDVLTSMEIVEPDSDLLVVTTGGYGKRTSLKEYSVKGRATMGMKTIDTNAIAVIGSIACARVVQKSDDLTIISANGVVLRTKVKDIKQAGRATRGVRLIHLDEGDSVASLARISAAELKKVGVGDEPDTQVEESETLPPEEPDIQVDESESPLTEESDTQEEESEAPPPEEPEN